MITETSKLLFFFSLTHKYTNSALCSWILFSIASAFFRILFKIKPTQRRCLSDSKKNKVPQSILFMGCYVSQEHQKTAWIQPL